jgi:hypothetical protein
MLIIVLAALELLIMLFVDGDLVSGFARFLELCHFIVVQIFLWKEILWVT